MTAVRLPFLILRASLLGLVVGLLALGAFVTPLYSQDISALSDFGADEFYENNALSNQNGSGNRSYVSQDNNLGGVSANYAEVNQTESDNDTSLVQLGSQNRVRVNQTGDSHTLSFTQTGFGNYADIEQVDNGNSVFATQMGDNNRLTVYQSSFATANLEEIGNNNTINLTQATNSIINIRLEGNNLTAIVNQVY